jgi:hypothetical protein
MNLKTLYIVVLAFSVSSAYAQNEQAGKNLVLFDPLFWKDQLKLDDDQCQKIKLINSQYYEKLDVVARGLPKPFWNAAKKYGRLSIPDNASAGRRSGIAGRSIPAKPRSPPVPSLSYFVLIFVCTHRMIALKLHYIQRTFFIHGSSQDLHRSV